MGSAEDQALLAEIARLTGQIDQAKAHPISASTSGSTSHAGSSYYQQPYSGYYGGVGSGSGSYYGSARGGYGRGRGRGAPGAGGSSSSVSRHRKLVLNNGDTSAASSTSPTVASSSTANASSSDLLPAAAAERATTSGGAGAGHSGWVKRKTTHNMSLVSADTFEKTEPARIAALQASQEAKAAARAAKRAPASSSSIANKSLSAGARSKLKGSSAAVRRGDNMGEVIIDGVVFVFDETGTKLVKKAQQQPSSDSASTDRGAAGATDVAAPGEQTSEGADGASKAPLRTSVNGQAFVRTKRGNLISAELLEKRRAQKESAAKLKRMAALGRQIGENERTRSSGKKSRNKTLNKADQGPKGLCSFFTKTGQCKRGLSCPFAHDPAKLAICPGALRPLGCTQPAGLCPLSHSLTSPERIPHCVHFLRSAGKSCRNGESCRYLHPPPALTAEVLSKEECPVCMDFARLGWCERGRACTARHTFDCADFLEKGSCERKGCRLQHNVVAREKMTTGPAGAGAGASGEQLAQDGGGGVSAKGEGGASTDETAAPYPSSGPISANHGTSKGGKRKRGGRAGAGVALVEPQEEEEGISFVGGSGKRKKAFQQKDFISFDDDDDDDDEEEEEKGEDERGAAGDHVEGQGELSEVDSVSSGEDDESSDEESESESDEEDEDSGSGSDSDDSSSEESSE